MESSVHEVGTRRQSAVPLRKLMHRGLKTCGSRGCDISTMRLTLA